MRNVAKNIVSSLSIAVASLSLMATAHAGESIHLYGYDTHTYHQHRWPQHNNDGSIIVGAPTPDYDYYYGDDNRLDYDHDSRQYGYPGYSGQRRGYDSRSDYGPRYDYYGPQYRFDNRGGRVQQPYTGQLLGR